MKLQLGQSLIELMVTIGLAAVILPALLTGFVVTRSGRAQGEQRQQAIALVREGQEAARIMREKDWTAFAVLSDGVTGYHPSQLANSWNLVMPDEVVNGLTRKIIISDVFRDISGNIASSGTLDPSVKKVVTTVSWTTPIPASVNATEYLTRFGNTVLSANGTVQPPASGYGDWCKPTQSLTTVDLSRQGTPTSVWAFEVGGIEGNRVFAGTGENASGPTFTNTKITGNSPPNATSLGEFNNTKANGIFGDGNYAYLATDKNSEEIIILNLSQFDPPASIIYKKVGWFNSPGPTDTNSVFVSGNVGFMTTGNKFYAFDLSDKTGSRPQIGSAINLAGVGVRIFTVGNYAYVATSGSTTKLQIINITDPANASIVGSLINSNWGDSRDIFVNENGTRSYLVTAASSTQPEFFIIDTTNKSNPALLTGGTYDTNGMDPQGVTVVTAKKAIIVGKNGALQYQVVDISNEASPTTCGTGLQISGGANAVSSISQLDGHAYSYIVTGDAHAELKIIEGGAGGGGTGNGIFESATLPFPDLGHNVAFNYFSGTADADLSYEIAIKYGIGGSCSGVTFADPDFVAISTGPIALPGVGFYNPGQCLRYRAINSGTTPKSYNVSINYSP